MKMMMRRIATLCATALLAGTPPAQIDRRNHRQWAWQMQQRRVLLAALAARPAGMKAKAQAAVAAALTQNSEAVPPLTLARALAVAKGITPDAGFLFRAGLQVFAMPEVASTPRFKSVSVTVLAPYVGLTGPLPMPKRFSFVVRVTDESGKEVWRGAIEERDAIRDLREYQATCEVPVANLPAGGYRVHVDTVLDGVLPRPHDARLGTSFAVLPNYGKRAGFFRVAEDASDLLGELNQLDRLPRAILAGAAELACRGWYGNPGVSARHAVPDLLRAERIRAAVRAGTFPLAGLTGYVPIALPGDGDDVVFVSLRLPAEALPPRGTEHWNALAAKPLVLFVASMPSLDHEDRRPSAPRFALPGYLAASLRLVDFDAAREFQVVVVESPGRIAMAIALPALLRSLPEVFPFDPNRIVLVGDGHGAHAVADLAVELKERVAGLVLVNGSGGLATPQMIELKRMPMLAIPGFGRIGADNIARLRDYAKFAEKREGLEILDDRQWPWCLAVPLAAREIEGFARGALPEENRGRAAVGGETELGGSAVPVSEAPAGSLSWVFLMLVLVGLAIVAVALLRGRLTSS